MHELEVICPYCGELVTLAIEEDLSGEMVWDCEVCCRPWSLRIETTADSPRLLVRTLDE